MAGSSPAMTTGVHGPGNFRSSVTEHLVQRRVISLVGQVRMEPAQHLHHHARIDLEDLQATVGSDHVDRSEAETDCVCSLDGELNAALPAITLLQESRARSGIEVVTPVQHPRLSRGHDRIELRLVAVADEAG